MISENYQIAIAEVLEYLKGIQKEDVEKISPNFMNFLKENASKNYKANIDYTKPLSELQLSDTSKAIISFEDLLKMYSKQKDGYSDVKNAVKKDENFRRRINS